jgi:uncharacterized protein YbaR (Trm112 family)
MAKKITIKYCPKCKDKLVSIKKNDLEVFICENCKFKTKK